MGERGRGLLVAATQHAGGGTAWLYELTWNCNPDEGSSHSLDMLLIFGTLTNADIAYAAEPADRRYPEEASRRLWSRHRFTTLGLTT